MARFSPSFISLLVLSLVLLVLVGISACPTSSFARQGDRVQTPAGSAVQLPRGMDPTDVIRTVHKNWDRNERWTRNRGVQGLNESAPGGIFPTEGIGPAFQIGIAPEGAEQYQELPAIAFDGTNYLVAWEDYRSSSIDLYCARVTASGEVLDPHGIVISAVQNAQGTPAVAFDGANYLVVWDDWRFSMNPNIYGARVSPEGVVLDTTSIISISTATNGQIKPAIAFDGTNCLVVWEDWRSGTPDIYGTRVDSDGTVLEPDGFAISNADNEQKVPAVAFNGTNYLVVWEDQRNVISDIYGARVSPAGSVLNPSGIAVSAGSNSKEYPSVSSDGTNWLVVWEVSVSFELDIYAARVAADGSVLDSGGIAVATADWDQTHAAVVFDGSSYVVVWEDWAGDAVEIQGARLNTAGVVVDNMGTIISPIYYDYIYPAIAFDGTNYLIAWGHCCGETATSPDLYGALVSSAGSVLAPGLILVSRDMGWQEFEDISFNGNNYLVVWENYRNGNRDIRGARVSPDGSILEPGVIVIPTGADYQEGPAVGFDGEKHLVVWDGSGTDGFGIYGAYVDTLGYMTHYEGISISAPTFPSWFPAVAFGGTNYLVVWDEDRSGTYDIFGARVDTSGTVLDPDGIAISTEAQGQHAPSVAFDGTNYLVVWEDERNGGGGYDIYGARVSPAGTVLNPDGIAISSKSQDEGLTSVAFDGTSYLVVWTVDVGDEWNIRGARVHPAGTVLDPLGIDISTAADDQWFPTAAFEGTHWLVVWNDFRDGTTDIYGARVDQSGNLLDPDGVLISSSASYDSKPALALGLGLSMLITHSRYTEDSYEAYRIWGNEWLGPTGLTFASAEATVQGGCVRLSWEMAVDVPASSFLVQRCDAPEGDFLPIAVQISKDSSFSFSCVDYSVQRGKTYWYKILLEGLSGDEAYGPIEVYVSWAPVVTRLHQSVPNPFNPFCTIHYEIASPGRASLQVFDVKGTLVRTLVDGWREAAIYSEVWDGRGEDGNCLPSGVYFYRLAAPGFFETRKMVLLR